MSNISVEEHTLAIPAWRHANSYHMGKDGHTGTAAMEGLPSGQLSLGRCPLSLSRGHGTVLPQLILGSTIIAVFLILGRWGLCFCSSSVQKAITEQRNSLAMLAGH